MEINNNYHGDYVAPEINVYFIMCQEVLCQSGTNPDMNEGWNKDWDQL